MSSLKTKGDSSQNTLLKRKKKRKELIDASDATTALLDYSKIGDRLNKDALSELFKDSEVQNETQSVNIQIQDKWDINLDLKDNQMSRRFESKIEDDAFEDEDNEGHSSLDDNELADEKRKRIGSCSNISRQVSN